MLIICCLKGFYLNLLYYRLINQMIKLKESKLFNKNKSMPQTDDKLIYSQVNKYKFDAYY